MKNITIIGINFYPEDSSTGLYTTQMAEYLSKYYNMNVVTGFPYYPEWEIKNEYKNKSKFLIEQKENIKIYRYKQYVPKNPTFKKRIFHLLDWTFGSFFNILKIKKADLVIGIVPFTTSIVLGLLLAKIRGAKVWVHIQDFEFDAAFESGLIKQEKKGIKAKIFDILFNIERTLFDKVDIISTISNGMMQKLKNKTKSETYYLPNWIDEKFIDPKKAKKHPFLISNKYNILYSGNIGEKQDWNFFIKVVEYFKDNDEIEFIVVGAGAKKEWLVKNTSHYKNVKHYDPVKYEELPDLLCSADLHVLFQKNNVIDTVMPSKLLGMMASAVPSVVTGNLKSEVAKVFEKSEGGCFFDSNDFEGVVQKILELSKNVELSKAIGLKAREYVIKNFSYEEIMNRFNIKLNEILCEGNK